MTEAILAQGKLLAYLKRNVEDVPQTANVIKIRQFSHGQSNPTYLLQVRCILGFKDAPQPPPPPPPQEHVR